MTESSLQIHFAGQTHPGLVRAHNEDSFAITTELPLFCVADGMGGHRGGAVASRHVCTRLTEEAVRFPVADVPSFRHALQDFLNRVDQEVTDLGVDNPELFRMGTTVVVLAPVPSEDPERRRFVIGNVGDSRVYLFRGGHLVQLTVDHSWYNDNVSRGLHPSEHDREIARNTISRCIGVGEVNMSDLFEMDALPGDVLILCSDGLHGYVPHSVITRILNEAVVQKDRNMEALVASLPDTLIGLANSYGGYDNVTVLSVGFGDAVPEVAPEPSPRWVFSRRNGELVGPLTWPELLESLKAFPDCRHLAHSRAEAFYARDSLLFPQALGLAEVPFSNDIQQLMGRLQAANPPLKEDPEAALPEPLQSLPPTSGAHSSDFPSTAPNSSGQPAQTIPVADPVARRHPVLTWTIACMLAVGVAVAAYFLMVNG